MAAKTRRGDGMRHRANAQQARIQANRPHGPQMDRNGNFDEGASIADMNEQWIEEHNAAVDRNRAALRAEWERTGQKPTAEWMEANLGSRDPQPPVLPPPPEG